MKNTIQNIGVVFLVLFSILSAAGTPAGTTITNTIGGTFKDSNNNNFTATSVSVDVVIAQKAGVDAGSAAAKNLTALSSVLYPVTITNAGNGSESNIDLSQSTTGGSGTYTVEIYSDNSGVTGVIDGDDAIVTGTGTLAADSTFNVIVKVTDATTGGADNGDQPVTTLTATSGFNGGVTASKVLTTTVLAPDLGTPTMTPSSTTPSQSDVITYAIYVANSGDLSAFDLTVVAPIPTNTTYVLSSMRYSTTNNYSSATPIGDGSGSTGDYNVTNTGDVTFTPGDLATSGGYYLFFQVTVGSSVSAGTTISSSATVDYNNSSSGSAFSTINVTGTDMTVASSNSVTVTPDDSTASSVPGVTVNYFGTVTNTGNSSDIFNITYTSSGSWTWALYKDNGTVGTYEDGTDVLLTDSGSDADATIDVGSVTAGSSVKIIARTTVPANLVDRTTDVLTVTATSVASGNPSDTGSLTTTITSPDVVLTITRSPSGNQQPGTTIVYTTTLTNSGSVAATNISLSNSIPANTTYVDNSIEKSTDGTNWSSQTDGASDDDVSCDGTTLSIAPASNLSVGGSVQYRYSVTID